ncbi:iron ABC transporter permease [Amaricoccus solimangrovi]|uniref:Iron ABC transporter permease n=1 Tax=Amaricoccus solimangrovi TaxID=2589815 RepID=A0A501WJ93_9RHOB|nr:iron ABC transporter permease [Amaricoccus solimangrovi]TPE49579.1 iron ABC transporter permease [Amaricoccus solimangrovi]
MTGGMTARAALLPLLLIAAAMLGLAWGQITVGPAALWHGAVSGEGMGAAMLSTFRGPRVATALGAGAALGIAGGLFQTLFRNPLASPDILGFDSGAALAVVAATAFGLIAPMSLVAAAGGLASAALVGVASYRRGHATPPLTMILVGLGIGFMTSALATFLMTLLPSNEAGEAQRWMTGSLAARSWDHVARIWIPGALLAAALLVRIRLLGALELGSDLAAGLGVGVAAARRGFVAAGVLLAALAVAVAGPVPFVALMSAPLGARLTGARGLVGRMLAAAGAGALILTLSDTIARSALTGTELPAGVLTGLLGAPYLLWRLSREMEGGGL